MAQSIAQTNALPRERDDHDGVALDAVGETVRKALREMASGSPANGGACLGKRE